MKIKTARDRAWKACSLYIRTKAAVNGQCKCVTCGEWNSIAETDAGHFVPKGSSNRLRYTEENVHCQCQRCNRFDGERAKILYTEYMRGYYGQEKIDELLAESRKLKRWRVGELLEIEEHYKQKLGEL